MQVQAKFQVVSHQLVNGSTQITLSPDYGDTASQLWSVAQPTANIVLSVTNPQAIQELAVGSVVTVTFSK